MYGRRHSDISRPRLRDTFDLIAGQAFPLPASSRVSRHSIKRIESGTFSVDDVLDDRIVFPKHSDSTQSAISNDTDHDLKMVRRRKRQCRNLKGTASYRLLHLFKGNNLSRVCDVSSCFGLWPSGSTQAIDDLIAEGVDLEHTDADGNFPLAIALHYREAKMIVERLLSAGADPHRRFRDGSLIDLALSMVHAHPYISVLLDHCVKLYLPPPSNESKLILIARLYDIEQQSKQMLQQMLFDAIRSDSLELVQTALAHGIRLQDVQQYREGLLHHAISISSSVQMIELLLQKGCDPNQLDTQRRCPLQIAILKQLSFPVVSLLLRYGADPSLLVANFEDEDSPLVTVAKFAEDHGICQDSIDAISNVYRSKYLL